MNKAAPGENYIEIKKCISFLNKKKVKIICQDLGIETIDQLEDACKAKRVSGLHGFGIKTEKKILEAIKIYKNPPPLEIIHFLDYCISIVIGSFIMMIYGPILGYELEAGRINDNQAVFSCISMCVNAFGGPFFLIILFRFMRHRWKTAKDSGIKQMKKETANLLRKHCGKTAEKIRVERRRNSLPFP